MLGEQMFFHFSPVVETFVLAEMIQDELEERMSGAAGEEGDHDIGARSLVQQVRVRVGLLRQYTLLRHCPVVQGPQRLQVQVSVHTCRM